MKRRFKLRRKENDQLSLQITSMADMFMIVLVFLLKSFSTNMMSISPSAGTLLPEAHASSEISDALKVEVSDFGIQVEGKPVASLEKAHFSKIPQEASAALQSLNAAFDSERKRQDLISSQNTDVHADSKLLILASQSVPYSTLKAVLTSAAAHGFSDFKLVVARKEN